MLTFPNAKINLGLNITAKREDGYHDIESCFYPIPLKDALEIIPSEKLSFETTGLKIPGNSNDNLVFKAYKLLKADFKLTPVDIILHKNIPMGAGMGGGSANGAFMLTLLNDYFELNISTQKLQQYALKLGSDCPFFIENKPKLISGRGEISENTELDLSGYYLALVYPNIHISTAEAYSAVKPKKPAVSVKEIIETYPIEKWKDLLNNDFEKGIFEKYPQLNEIKNKFYSEGAIYSSMTGSGSTIFGIFKESSEKNYDTILAL
ncbi:4-diphosphocytidyl-2-C-methyl-D-erythritol kinase [Marivirga tractuosa]|uniref:4-diphosphocytidyl-2-C-methyl-D-erythritol kinase n=1 Tax=Marivirga tractuosa (strain ATCC 23168 / DSM 4126 / NBRC 15989 / NCIMB 1408 / VKM B-1430 / H-43) TaxID=643867 RepID=E4TMM7_MARTH|nr:4-(cytidine 5'-diphospho)-2-C-methyl-D-erythritol kinase [Marivirga tractuosa]ADR20325.1 4-diphosphocytidyl-2-C-methyl-D-erythritol kinase [Marivirga tractuosa DSM 4126]BDD15233.1 4-diphosphocytidyl-2-C-methyl-D-erythritol kinase [Marivirga tractuosa]